MALAVLLLATTLAGCTAPREPLTYEASFELVPGEAQGYALRVLNATLGNVTVQVAGPALRAEVRDRPDGGVTRVERAGVGTIWIDVRTEEVGRAAPSAVPTWTVRLDGLRENSYSVRANVQRFLCGSEGCEMITDAQVENLVRVTKT